LTTKTDSLVLIHKKWIGGVVVQLAKLDETQRFGEFIHAALRAVEINTPNTIAHDFLAGSAHEPIDHLAAARTKILLTGVNSTFTLLKYQQQAAPALLAERPLSA
jgi:hypothetical protein